MQTIKRYTQVVAAVGFLAIPAMAQNVHPRPQYEHIHLLGNGTASPTKLDLRNSQGDQTKFIDFDKTNGAAFTVVFPKDAHNHVLNPCMESTIGTGPGASRTCTLLTSDILCVAGQPPHDAGSGLCKFTFSTGAGDPEIDIEPGYGNPPPPPGGKGKNAKKANK
jgi:hypothetical protein